MRISEKGIALNLEFESFVAKPYLCPAGKWTQGIGSTINMDTLQRVKKTDPPITFEKAIAWKKKHVEMYVDPVIRKYVKIELNQNQYDALAMFVYNTGGTYPNAKGIYVPYKLFHLINAKVKDSELKAYWEKCAITSEGVILNGLIRRRKAEVNLFLTK